MFGRVCAATAVVFGIATTAPVGAAPSDDLRDGGAYDAITVNGVVLALDDIDRLIAAGLLVYDPEQQKFSFNPSVTSERQLGRALNAVPDVETRPIRDLYRLAHVPLPNAAAHTLTVPSGYGPAVFTGQREGPVLGLGIGGVSRVPYTEDPDGGVAIGLGFGNAFETVGASVALSFNDLSDIGNSDRVSLSFQLSRYLWDGLSLSVGGENLLVKETDGEESFYMVGSWAFDQDSSALPFDGVLTLGAGSGRFANMTERDIVEGKGDSATALFGALAVEVGENANLIADWNGRNLSLGVGYRFPGNGISVRLGVRDVTGNSGDGPRLTGSLGVTVLRF